MKSPIKHALWIFFLGLQASGHADVQNWIRDHFSAPPLTSSRPWQSVPGQITDQDVVRHQEWKAQEDQRQKENQIQSSDFLAQKEALFRNWIHWGAGNAKFIDAEIESSKRRLSMIEDCYPNEIYASPESYELSEFRYNELDRNVEAIAPNRELLWIQSHFNDKFLGNPAFFESPTSSSTKKISVLFQSDEFSILRLKEIEARRMLILKAIRSGDMNPVNLFLAEHLPYAGPNPNDE